MKYEIHKHENYLLVLSDDEIKEGECYLSPSGIWFYNHLNPNHTSNSKKVIAHLPLNEDKVIEGVDLLPNLKNKDEYPTHFSCTMIPFIDIQDSNRKDGLCFTNFKTKDKNGRTQWLGEYSYETKHTI